MANGNTKAGGKASAGVGYAERWGKKQTEGTNAPILGEIGNEHVQQLAGAGESIAGIANGNYKQFGRGTAKWAGGVLGSLTGGIFGANKPPDPTYIGGSAEALQARRDQQQQGIGQGAQYTNAGMGVAAAGAGMLGGAYGSAAQDQGLARQYADNGLTIGASSLNQQQAAMARQNGVTAQMLATAGQQGPSAAQAQLQMGLDQSQRAMMAQAAGARGGNAASAMRMAAATGSNMANDVNQQAAVLRAQEAQQQQMNLLGAQQAAAGIYGGQQQTMGNTAQLGYGMQGQGIGMSQASTGQQGQFGANVGSIGLGMGGVGNQQQGNYLDAQTKTDVAQLDADEKQESAKQASKGGVMGMAKNVIGSFF